MRYDGGSIVSSGVARLPRAGWSARALVLFSVICTYFFISWTAEPLFFSNQNTYFLQGLRLAGVEGVQHDWLSQTRAPHIAFTWLVALLQKLSALALGVRTLEIVLYIALLWSFWSL
ncbi:MAG: hypothetical protein ABL961_16600, partial [Vicinamibacterales bacterium]